ncbi:MAG: response regulator [Candidatus Limnocylindrales bacterium]
MPSRSPRWWRRSLQSRLVASFVVLSAVTILVVGAVVYVRATADLTSAVFLRLGAVAANKADALDRWIDEQTRNAVYVGSIPGFGDDARSYLDATSPVPTRTAAEARIRQDLRTIVQGTADAEEIFILDLDGTIRLSTLADHEGETQAHEPFFGDGSSHTTVQNVYTSTLTSRSTITVATPLFDQDGSGQRVAVLAANLSLQRLDRIIQERTGLGDSGRTYLVGTDHRLIQGAVPDGEVGRVDSDGIGRALAQENGQGLYLDDRAAPVVGVYRWLANRGAGLLAEISQDEALGPARELALIIGLVGLVSTLLLSAGIWIVARRVTRPILALATTASRVAGGDLEAVSGIRSDDELGTLATAFDGMTAQLRESVATLERRVAERTVELTRQRQYYASLVEVSPVAVVTMDPDERVSAWNPAATTLFGYAPDEAIGRRIDKLILRSDELRAEGRDLARKAVGGRVQRIGQRMRKDGSLVDVEILMVPLVVEDEPLGFYAIYHDISELQAARREADDANQAKSSFLAAMSHEIRTPMNAVIGMSGLLTDTRLDAEQRDYAETIRTSGEALLTIINDILDFSKIEAGRIELDAAPFALAGTIEGALDVMGPIAAGKGVDLVYDPAPDLPVNLVGDAGRVRQIVLNLLSNAIKFTERGEVVLSVGGDVLPAPEGAGSAAADRPWALRLDVRDTGIGIPPDRIGRLFQSFSQAEASISRRFGGTGLGLAISRRLAELMGGSMTAESSGISGEGSTFHLVVHLAEATLTAGDSAHGSPPDAALPTAVAAIAGRRVLLVDDNAASLHVLAAQLGRLGLAVSSSGNPREALALATVEPADFALVVSDHAMPDLDGPALAAAVQSANLPSPPQVVVLSAAGQRDRNAAGIAAYVSKPVKPEVLRDTVIAILTSQPLRSAPRPAERPSADAGLGARYPLRILLAEDNAVNQKLALRLLERMGYTADLAGNGVQAIEALERAPYDIVLMDIQMPELDGLEASRLIRSRWPDRTIRIVAMTANAMEGDREACLSAGMDDYVSKPIRPDELAAALQAVKPVG